MAVKKNAAPKKVALKGRRKKVNQSIIDKIFARNSSIFPTISHETIRKMNGFILILILLFYTADVAHSEGNL